MEVKIWVALFFLMLTGAVVANEPAFDNNYCFPFGSAEARKLKEVEDGGEDLEALTRKSVHDGDEVRIPRGIDASVSGAASALGIVEGDLSSANAQLSKCCYSSFICYWKGGICLPSWLKPFFKCYEDGLCYHGSCTCFKPRDTCQCEGSCGKQGTCKISCAWSEVPTTGICKSSNCKCCAPCQGACTGGQCRKSCLWYEYDGGQCPGSKSCRCCKKCSGSCGKNRWCRKTCSSSETQVGTCNSGKCRCCERCSGTCSGGGKCRKSCSANEMSGGKCPGTINCQCCKPKETVDCEFEPCGKNGRCRPYCSPPRNIEVSGHCPGSGCVCCQFKPPGPGGPWDRFKAIP